MAELQQALRLRTSQDRKDVLSILTNVRLLQSHGLNPAGLFVNDLMEEAFQSSTLWSLALTP